MMPVKIAPLNSARRTRAFARITYGLLGLFVLAVIGATAGFAYQNHTTMMEREMLRAQNNALVFEDQTSQTLQIIENTLRALPQVSDKALTELPGTDLSALLKRLQSTEPALRSLAVLDAQGLIRASSNEADLGAPVDLSVYLPSELPQSTSPALRLGLPLNGLDFADRARPGTTKTTAPGQPYSIALALRLGNDEPALWVLAAVDTDYWRKHQSRYSKSETDHVEWRRMDDSLLASTRALASGTALAPFVLLKRLQTEASGSDTSQDLTAFSKSARYPFFVTVQLSQRAALAQLQQRFLMIAGFALLVLLTVIGSTVWLMRRIRHIEIIERAPKQALALALDKSEAANRAKSEFLTVINHKIAGPLDGIVSMTALMRDTPLSATQRSYLQVVKSAGQALQIIASEALDFSKK